ncbi:MAG: hypothetical protein HC878_08805 [Leptolyngbyaceae cyanobacterium SL_5_14]|nr:hypothetical protein [Leptolyngbyaceae cyanobacterium SL_5_14]
MAATSTHAPVNPCPQWLRNRWGIFVGFSDRVRSRGAVAASETDAFFLPIALPTSSLLHPAVSPIRTHSHSTGQSPVI